MDTNSTSVEKNLDEKNFPDSQRRNKFPCPSLGGPFILRGYIEFEKSHHPGCGIISGNLRKYKTEKNIHIAYMLISL